jgi:hypothetical protein
MTSEIVGKEVITREKGYLYCVTSEGNVDRVPAKSNKTGTRKTVSTQPVKKEKGYLYFVGKSGRIERSKMRNAKE